jgi:hypothetical protein
MRPAAGHVVLVLALLGGVGCGDDEPGAQEPATVDTTTTADATTTTVATTTTSAAASAIPSEVVGSWQTVLPDGDELRLTLSDRGYQISRVGAGTASGRLDADGAQLVFSNSLVCDGTGTYTFTVTDTSLQLAATTPDECPGRAAAIDGHTFEPVG